VVYGVNMAISEVEWFDIRMNRSMLDVKLQHSRLFWD